MKKALLVMALAATATYAGWRWMSDDVPATATGKSLALDRLWIDHVPTGPRDELNVFVALTEEPVGLFQKASQWRGRYELFRFEAHGDELRVVYPQTGERERVRAKARACSVGGMDYCLELEGASRGVKRYYSREGWEIDGAGSAAQLAQRVGVLLEQLPRAAQ